MCIRDSVWVVSSGMYSFAEAGMIVDGSALKEIPGYEVKGSEFKGNHPDNNDFKFYFRASEVEIVNEGT